MRKKVYVAHEYGRRHGLSDWDCELNVDECIEFYIRPLILKGYNPFCPLLWHYIHRGWDASPGEPVYFDLVADWIKDCDYFLVAKLPKWEGSGVVREIKIADSLHIPVYYNIEDIGS